VSGGVAGTLQRAWALPLFDSDSPCVPVVRHISTVRRAQLAGLSVMESLEADPVSMPSSTAVMSTQAGHLANESSAARAGQADDGAVAANSVTECGSLYVNVLCSHCSVQSLL